MSAIDLSKAYGISYSFCTNRLQSGELVCKPPKSPEEVCFLEVNFKPPLGRPSDVVAKIVDTIVRHFLFEKKAEISSSIELKLRITQAGIKTALAPKVDYPEDQNFSTFVNSHYGSFPFKAFSGPDTLIDLKIDLIHPGAKGMGLATGYFRYPHMLADMRIRFAFDRFKEDAQVCIIGPGLMEYNPPKPGEKPLPDYVECPQFVEVLSLFNRATFTLLDIDQKSLAAYRQSFVKEKTAFYDPLTLRVLSMQTLGTFVNPKAAPASYEPVFSLVKTGLVNLVDRPDQVKSMLEGYGEAKPVSVKVSPEKIFIKEHDILDTQMTPPGLGYDVIIGTHSIGNAYHIKLTADGTFDITRSFTEILSAIRPGGALYLDTLAFRNVISWIEYSNQRSFDDYLERVESQLNNKMKVEEVTHKTFYPEADEKGAVSRSFLLSQDGPRTLGCTSITVITRTMEPFRK